MKSSEKWKIKTSLSNKLTKNTPSARDRLTELNLDEKTCLVFIQSTAKGFGNKKL
jgi:hypothetical protein